jgi:hypothetical protein
MAVMAFAIEQDGETQTIEIDVTLDPGKYTLRELVRLENVIGSPAMVAMLRRDLDITPKVLQAAVWTKLVDSAPDLELANVDLPAGVFAAYAPEPAELEAVDVG